MCYFEKWSSCGAVKFVREALLKKRKSHDTQIKYLESCMVKAQTLTVKCLAEYRTQVVELRKENVDLHDSISVKSTDEGYKQHEKHFFELAERINQMKVTLDALLSSRQMESTLLDRSAPILTQSSNSFRVGSDVRLPKLDPPVFAGDLYTWLSFHDLFKALIHDNPALTGAQKLQYLKASLKGEPALLIQSIPIADVNYMEAWGLLLSRYECKRELIRAQMDRLIS